jgi:hypothetical protein
MIELFTGRDNTGAYYITYEKDRPISDIDVSKDLNLSIEEYQSILSKYGAYGIEEYGECYFKKKKDVEYCVKCLEQEINALIESQKCLCDCIDRNVDDICIVKNEETGKFELQFWGWNEDNYQLENMLVIDFCPKCGRKL